MDEIKHLSELIKGIRFAMLNTVGENGEIHSRPMATQEAEFDGDLWFFTRDDSPKVKEMIHHRSVNLNYVDVDGMRYVTLNGKGELRFDKAKMQELWNPLLKSYFPEGLEDPHIALIVVHVESAHYWESPGGQVKQIYGMAKAILTGETYSPGVSKHIDLEKRAG